MQGYNQDFVQPQFQIPVAQPVAQPVVHHNVEDKLSQRGWKPATLDGVPGFVDKNVVFHPSIPFTEKLRANKWYTICAGFGIFILVYVFCAMFYALASDS